MDLYSVIVIDDLPEAQLNLVSTITGDFNERLNLIGAADNVADAIVLINEKKPDIVFFDVELNNDQTCFDILSQIQEPKFFSVFVTGFEHYALKAFEFAALDYILKPVSSDDLSLVIKKIDTIRAKTKNLDFQLKNRLQTYFENRIEQSTKRIKKIVLSTESNLHIVGVKDIIRCESDKGYTTIYLTDQKVLVSKVIKEYDDLLSEYGFFRTHKSHLINMDFIQKYVKADGGYILLKDGSKVPLLVRKKQLFLEQIQF